MIYSINIEIVDVYPGWVNESVQNKFRKRINEDCSSYPDLFSYGIKLNNIKSIFRCAFLIRNWFDPSNGKAPLIQIGNGQF
jgi:hypothetical protein